MDLQVGFGVQGPGMKKLLSRGLRASGLMVLRFRAYIFKLGCLEIQCNVSPSV